MANRIRRQREGIMFGSFGKNDPRKMPSHLFSGVRHLDYSTAKRADVAQQNFSVCPRHWYVDAAFQCARCGEPFVFTVDEQKFWYEQLKFWIDSIPRQCAKCRKELRQLKTLQQEYDRSLAGAITKSASLEDKEHVVETIKAIESGGVMLATQVTENRSILERQIQKWRLRK